MNYEKLFGLILDLGRDLIRCGGETHRVEDTLYRLAAGYRFRDCSIWVVPSLIQATFTDPDGVVRTQIRHVKGSGVDFRALDRLNAVSRWACGAQPAAEELAARLEEIRSAAQPRLWASCLSEVLGGWGFALFFGCDVWDSAIAALASLLVFFLVRVFSRREGNPLILNFSVSFVTEVFILCVCHFGPGSHMETITISVVMLLVSGLGAFNGLRDLVHLDTLSGLINLAASFTGAIGIALGMALPMLIFRDWGGVVVSTLEPQPIIQVFAGAFACVGFSILFGVRGWKIVFCALGAGLTWGYIFWSIISIPPCLPRRCPPPPSAAFTGRSLPASKNPPQRFFPPSAFCPCCPAPRCTTPCTAWLPGMRSSPTQEGSDWAWSVSGSSSAS